VQAIIKHRDASAEYYTEERCHINELSNSLADPAVSIAQARVMPGDTTRWHRLHGIVERYVITQGAGLVEVGELLPQPVLPGDVVLIPPGCRQRIANTGKHDLVFLAICSPRFEQQYYQDAENEPSQL
jgi:hypothetical protein